MVSDLLESVLQNGYVLLFTEYCNKFCIGLKSHISRIPMHETLSIIFVKLDK